MMEYFTKKQKRMNIYENIYIGSFIFQLGIIVGQRKQEHYSSVNLFQQTPADKTYGDLLTSVNGKYLLIEFKRKQNSNDKKEKKKANALKEKLITLKQLSRQCHFLGIGDENGINCTIEYYAYMDFFNGSSKKYDRFIEKFLKPKKKTMLAQAVSDLEDDLQIVGVNYNEFKRYLDILKSIYTGDNSSSAGGIIVCVEDDGTIGMIPTENVNELIKRLNDNIEADLINQEDEPSLDGNKVNMSPTFGR